ncbi:glycosyltransferase [Segetibacter sp. 3557_3]|uniref:glycosyltransferase n=1 Tax=Segetibacter sp. 3557_3 TaxID=2547429 RepID=UPI00105892ED|nr:glycosyltransferase [Segetibacter sp. 3557_3]TDH24042.1 glycosyltransferase [Segetibacter sp. 3557_3]
MTWLLLLLIALLLGGYATLIENYRRWFLEVKPFAVNKGIKPTTSFSIIIPARNEEEQIGACLESVLTQNYPPDLYEVIVIDDHSTDRTAEIIVQYQQRHTNLRLFNLEELLPAGKLNSYKKKAIELAIEKAAGDWIVTTDADCKVRPNWLRSFDGFRKERNAVFIAAPVKFTNTGSFISIFQCLDFISLQGITAASVNNRFHSMCNGANLAYSKAVFNEAGKFAGIDDIASGDDMLLMHKIFLKHPRQVRFLLSDEVITETLPMPDWTSFLNQRIRWASKAESYEDKRIFWVLVSVYLFNLSLVLLPILALWVPVAIWYWLLLIVCKTIIELRFMLPVARFFNERSMLWWFPVMQPFHILYTVIAGWLGKFGTYQWKGRTVK